ncbi:dihydroorotase [Sporolactobacillus laevolacticus]|uniref:dihydroorotase n=1 Tax=Sporolactobacillus laevolacticus TaxID=33018 RepID=UPI0025B299DC|nr:dihydroorotase [Sporolactobacillus laevolacticus]MDN3954814.1 dihydroorotase [Sporolactobacillus laevolacticus]
MRCFDKVIRGRLVLKNKVVDGEIGIDKEKIAYIAANGETLEGDTILDFGKSYVFPGMIDEHVHCFSNPEEGFVPTSAAAAVGGVTTFFDMPYDRPHPINSVEIFKDKVKRMEGQSYVDICLWSTIAKQDGTDQILPLAEAGAVAFKMSTFETDPFRFPRIPDPEILKAMNLIKNTGLVAAFHSENDDIIFSMIDEYKKENKVYPRAHMETRPPVTETSAILKLLEFAYWTGVDLHIVHVSHPRSLELIKQFQQQGVHVTCETCYPYLLLDVHDLEKFGPKSKMNPPVRYPEDVKKMWEHLEKGTIDFISSDHSPWGLEQKDIGNENIFKAASGLPGVEIIVPLMFDSGVASGRLTPIEFANLMSTHAAEIFKVPNKGLIAEGYDADFTVIDPEQVTKIDKDKLHSKVKLTPFHGKECRGKVISTIVRGTVVYNGKEIAVQQGYGKFVAGAAAKQSVTK